ncbi:MAG TPA: hypothetical protein VGC41_03590, partial [Kofleriaceae bacterium]
MAQPVVLRIKLRYDDVDAMVQRFAPNVGKNGLFLPTKSIQPVGTEIKFELRLSNDQPVLVGLGKVKAAKAPDPANPRAAFGLAIELMRVTREGREVIIRMIERRRALGLPDVAIPMPEDVEASKRSDVETQPRVEIAAISKEPERDSSPILEGTPPPKSPAKAKPVPAGDPTKTNPGVSSFTAPRAAVTKEQVRPTAPSLPPEPLRAKRPRLADVIASAGPGAMAKEPPELDGQVDLERAMARARVLAGGDLDAELADLRESSAAPLAEISIEAASAELAQKLGGASVSRRNRMPVPALGTSEMPAAAPVEEVPPPVALFGMSSLIENNARESTVIGEVPLVRPEDAPVPAPVAPVEDRVVEGIVERVEALAVAQEDIAPVAEPPEAEAAVAEQEPEDPDLGSFGRELDAARMHTGATQAAPELDDDDIAELDPDDIEELPGESTQIGAVASAVDARLGTAQPIHLADSLDRHLDEVEADNEIARSIAAAAQEYEAELAVQPGSTDQEIDDLDVLAEADAGDADLLGSNGEQESQDHAAAYRDSQQYAAQYPNGYA